MEGSGAYKRSKKRKRSGKFGWLPNEDYDPMRPATKYYNPKYIPVKRDLTTLLKYGPSKYKASIEQLKNRIADRYRGRGMYTGHGAYLGDKASAFLKANDLGLLSGVGQRVGDAIQHKAEDIGRGLWGGIKRFFGRGAYDATMSNALIHGSDFTVPSFAKHGDSEEGAICISHKEYITDVYGPTSAFNNQSYQINPGLEQSFPWLSQIAQNFDEYEFKQLMYSYRSTTTDIGSSTNGQCGTIIMCTNYNASADPFQDKQSMMEYEGCGSSKTTEHQYHGVECDPSKLSGAPGKYTRANGVVIGQDIKTYDHAQFNFAIANSPTGFQNQAIGEMWVSYTVILRKPKFFVARGLGVSQDIFVNTAPTDGGTLFGPVASLLNAVENNIGCKLNVGSNSFGILFPAGYSGQLEIKIYMEATGGSAWNNSGLPIESIVLSGNVSGVKDIYGADGVNSTDLPTDRIVNMNHTTGSMVAIIHVKVTQATGGAENVMSFFCNSQTAGIKNLTSCYISEYNGGFGNKTNPATILQNSSGQIVVP